MKKLLLVVCMLLTACGTSRVVVVAPETSFNSSYRKTKEVLLVSCTNVVVGQSYRYNFGKARKLTDEVETYSVVETTDTGERFEMSGCYGQKGDRFKISY